jgi:hypothetical protein
MKKTRAVHIRQPKEPMQDQSASFARWGITEGPEDRKYLRPDEWVDLMRQKREDK